MKRIRPSVAFVGSLAVAAGALALATAANPDFWSSPDQRGDRSFRAGRFDDAARVYRDPYRRGVALYRAGNFKDAAASFATVATADSEFNRGNALAMLGKYDDSIRSYDRALGLRPGWKEAQENRAIAIVRRDRLRTQGGDATQGQVEPDEIAFDKNKRSPAADEVDMAAGQAPSDEQLRSLWLRNVQTKPADFLRAKFAFQIESRGGNSP